MYVFQMQFILFSRKLIFFINLKNGIRKYYYYPPIFNGRIWQCPVCQTFCDDLIRMSLFEAEWTITCTKHNADPENILKC